MTRRSSKRPTRRYRMLAACAAAAAGLLGVGVLVGSAAGAAPGHAAGERHNPCAFLAPDTPGELATTATYLESVIGIDPGPPAPTAVQIVPGEIGYAGADFQDGVCTVNGAVGWYTGTVAPCVPPAAGDTCSPAYMSLTVVTAPIADAEADLHAYGAYGYTVRTELLKTGGHGKLACATTGACVAWFTKGTKFVYIYNQNIKVPAGSAMTAAAQDIYAHTTLWSTEKPPRGAR